MKPEGKEEEIELLKKTDTLCQQLLKITRDKYRRYFIHKGGWKTYIGLVHGLVDERTILKRKFKDEYGIETILCNESSSSHDKEMYPQSEKEEISDVLQPTKLIGETLMRSLAMYREFFIEFSDVSGLTKHLGDVLDKITSLLHEYCSRQGNVDDDYVLVQKPEDDQVEESSSSSKRNKERRRKRK
ncbi:hypothetical protein Dimus_001875 [Dionaea muscipula]